jgi:translocation and assembly module TamB
LAAKTDLKVIGDFDRDVYSSGNADLNVTIRGTFNQPVVNGQLRLQNASLNMVDLPNGISNANGIIQFNGTNAVFQNLTAESGGGRVTANGYIGFANNNLRYGLRANAGQVRVRTPQGATVVISANINLTGNGDHSVLGGNVTINKISFNPRSDFGSILSRSAPPPQTPSAPSGITAGMKLDIRIRTAPDVAFQTALAQNIQADADLTLRGTIANPGMLGRVNVTSGNLIFFGTTYNINSGSVSFYNPNDIDPILDIDLETKVQGVDVILTVSGPVANMKLTYRSDPPLQFNEIIALLATGRTPTSDPTILANQPTPPPQSLQQMGESAIVSQAIANPLANRLQRVFGISQLKVDPTFTSGSSLPQARVSLQQQVSNNVTFTYIQDFTQANSEIIRVEWTINPTWSAMATRDEFGRFGVDFFYKKQFR